MFAGRKIVILLSFVTKREEREKFWGDPKPPFTVFPVCSRKPVFQTRTTTPGVKRAKGESYAIEPNTRRFYLSRCSRTKATLYSAYSS